MLLGSKTGDLPGSPGAHPIRREVKRAALGLGRAVRPRGDRHVPARGVYLRGPPARGRWGGGGGVLCLCQHSSSIRRPLLALPSRDHRPLRPPVTARFSWGIRRRGLPHVETAAPDRHRIVETAAGSRGKRPHSQY